LAAVLNILHDVGLDVYTLCPESDFVRRSRWYRPLPVARDNPRPADLATVLEALPFPEAVLLPCSDDWLRAVTELPPGIANRFPSSTPGKGVEILVDKWRFSQLLDALRIPHPRTRLVNSREELEALDDRDLEGALLKPLSSVEFASRHGVKGYLVENREEALAAIRRIELPILIQEFIPGPPTAGYFLDGFRDRTGQIRALFARRRIRMYPPKLGNSTVTFSVPLDEVEGATVSLESVLQRIAYRGIFSAEFKQDPRGGTFKLIEINARPWWYVEFAARCGVDVCSMAYWDALGTPIDPVTSYAVGRSSVFMMNDFRAWRDSSSSGGPGVWSLLHTWYHAMATPFHWNDPRPVLQYLGQVLSSSVWSRFGRPVRPRVKPEHSLVPR
jgi:D-aspartate ligase